MATRYWEGTTSTDWGVATNWSDDTVPVSSNDVVFDGRGTLDSDGLNRSALLNMDQTGVDLAKLHVMSSYTGTIGAAGGPLIIEVSSGGDGKLIIEGTGDCYIQVGNGANDAFVDTLIVNTSGTVGLSSQKNAGAVNVGTFTAAYFIRGTILVYGDADKATTGAESGTNIATMYIVPKNGKANNVTVTIGDLCYDIKTTTYGTINMRQGNVTSYSSLLALNMFDGTFTIGGTGYDMSANDDNITTLTQYDGTIYWKPTDTTPAPDVASPSPTITTAWLIGGKFDATDILSTATSAPTITTAHQFESSKVDLRNGYSNIVGTTWNKYGGELYTDPGQSITLS